jgi:hypothetical protein
MRPLTALHLTILALAFAPQPVRAQGDAPAAGAPQELFKAVEGKIDASSIEGLLLKTADGQVSAASLAGVKADVVEEVHNLRDYSVALKALDKNSSGVGFAVTPARTRSPFPSVSLKDYAGSGWVRFSASTTFSYAQGTAPVSGKDFVKQAVSIGSSGFFHADHDPVVRLASAGECKGRGLDALAAAGLDAPTLTAAQIVELARVKQLEAKAAANDAAARREIDAIRAAAVRGDATAKRQVDALKGYEILRLAQTGDPAAKAQVEADRAQSIRVKADPETAALEAFNKCAKEVLDKLGKEWNRSRYSVSFGAGTVKAKDGSGSSVSLGRTLAGSVLYGFEHVEWLRSRAALTVTVRRTQGEPISSTLGSASVRTKDSTLTGLRLTAGTDGFRVLVEGNNRKSDAELGAAESTLRRAAGLDVKLMDGAWLSLRYGRQRKLIGAGDENASFLVLNLSPSALLDYKR